MTYKENCGFMKIGCCTFKPEHCRAEADETSKHFCDLYNIEFTSKAVKKELDRVKKEVKKLVKENLKLSELKAMRKLEKVDILDPKIIKYKKKMLKLKDLGKGMEYLEKAYRHLKRSRR